MELLKYLKIVLKYGTRVNVMLSLLHGISIIIEIHPEGDMNVLAKFHGIPSNICWAVSVWIKVLDWRTDRPTSIDIRRATMLVWMKIRVIKTKTRGPVRPTFGHSSGWSQQLDTQLKQSGPSDVCDSAIYYTFIKTIRNLRQTKGENHSGVIIPEWPGVNQSPPLQITRSPAFVPWTVTSLLTGEGNVLTFIYSHTHPTKHTLIHTETNTVNSIRRLRWLIFRLNSRGRLLDSHSKLAQMNGSLSVWNMVVVGCDHYGRSWLAWLIM